VSRAEVLDIDAFLAIHPWPEDLRKYGKPLEWLWYFDLEGDLMEIWNRLADTSRFNRALGVSKMVFREQQGVLHGQTHMGGARQEWIEEPWQWVAGRWLGNVRRYSRGLAHANRGIYHFEPLDPTRVRYYAYFGWIPRNPVSSLLLRLGMSSLGKAFGRLVAQIERELEHHGPGQFTAPAPALAEAGRARVAAVRAALAERLGRSQTLDRLIDHVSQGDELDLYRIQVPALARAWGVNEDELLRLCLHATREGLLKLSWDVICPHCRGVREEASSLGSVPRLGS
jgi:hypothetical protein